MLILVRLVGDRESWKQPGASLAYQPGSLTSRVPGSLVITFLLWWILSHRVYFLRLTTIDYLIQLPPPTLSVRQFNHKQIPAREDTSHSRGSIEFFLFTFTFNIASSSRPNQTRLQQSSAATDHYLPWSYQKTINNFTDLLHKDIPSELPASLTVRQVSKSKTTGLSSNCRVEAIRTDVLGDCFSNKTGRRSLASALSQFTPRTNSSCLSSPDIVDQGLEVREGQAEGYDG